MTTSASVLKAAQKNGARWEVPVLMLVMLGISLVVPSVKTLAILIPIVYLIVESRLRHRTWADNGFVLKSIPRELVRNLGWVLLVGIGTQVLAVFGTHYLFPEFSAHVMARAPIDLTSLSVGLFVALALSTLGEEVIFRALYQNRMQAFLPVWAAIGLSSLVFALMHYAAGPALIVFTDVALVFIDSVIYGIIFAKSKNVFVSWIAHFMADVVGLACLLTLMK